MTQLLVLGLLKEKPLSGYDIQMMLQTSEAEKWGGVLVGSIYHALRKLEKNKYIDIAYIEQTGQRQKAVYQITENGIKHLFMLTDKSLRESTNNYPVDFYSGLKFMDFISEEQRLDALLEHKRKLEKKIESLTKGNVVKEVAVNNQLSVINELIFENMCSTINQQIEFVEKLIKLLEQP